MTELNYDHMVQEIQDNIQTGDMMKARLVFSHIAEVDDKTRNRLIYELSRGDMSFTVPLLLFLLDEHSDVTDAMPIVRETLLSSLIAYPEMLLTFLASPEIKDKTHLVQIAGDLRFEEATLLLIEMISDSTNEAMILLIVETLGHIGDPEATNTLTEYLYAANRELITAAVQSLGQVGTPTAMHRLAERMGTENELDFMILSTFAAVQEQVSLEKLNETLDSDYAHMRT